MQKYKRKQSAQDRQKRLEKGCCPIHGIPMLFWACKKDFGENNFPSLTSNAGCHDFIVICPRRDCCISGVQKDLHGPLRLSGKFESLLLGE
jgi:hypothetical protein